MSTEESKFVVAISSAHIRAHKKLDQYAPLVRELREFRILGLGLQATVELHAQLNELLASSEWYVSHVKEAANSLAKGDPGAE